MNPARRLAPRALATTLAAALALGAVLPAAAQDGTDRWLLRARALRLEPGIDDGIGLFITIEPLRFTELSLTWFATPAWAVELAATVPQAHAVRSAGFEVGQLRQLPPTLVLQYHLGRTSGWPVQPYLSAGISYTLVDNLRFAPDVQAALQPTLRNRSVGPVWGLGVELPLGRFVSLHADWKQLRLKTDVEALGPGVGHFRVAPRYVGVGIGVRF